MHQSQLLVRPAEVALAGPRRRRRLLDTLGRLRRNRGAMIGATLLLVEVLSALLAPYLAPYDPIGIDTTAPLQGPSLLHLFGTDSLGRDIFSRVLHGARISLQLGIVSVGVAASIGVTLGILAGYFSGLVDMAVMRVIDAMLAFPGILMALAIVAVLGPSMNNVMLAVGISAVPSYARLVRSAVLSVKEMAYVEAARCIGCLDLNIMRRHIFPNVMAPIIVLATLGVANAIFVAASLSYLGVGAQPPTPEWGSMISRGRDQLRVAWWISTFPGIAIFMSVLSINMLGDGLRDVLDPRLKERGA